jgi:hypothetical protein
MKYRHTAKALLVVVRQALPVARVECAEDPVLLVVGREVPKSRRECCRARSARR